MKPSCLTAAIACALVLLAGSSRAAGGDDDEQRPRAPAAAAALALSPAQQQAVGIQVAHPLKAAVPKEIAAVGTVLDPAELVADVGRLASSRAGARNALADARRVAGLYQNNANASLKAVQASAAAQVESQAQLQAAATTFALQWGPVASLSDTERTALIASLSSGKSLLVRADVPGQHLLGTMPAKALLSVDGIAVAARVLGPLPRTAPDLQSAGWLLEVEHAPTGLGPGARVRVVLAGAAVAGLLVPSAALLYGDAGAYVYRAGRRAERRWQIPIRARERQAACARRGWLARRRARRRRHDRRARRRSALVAAGPRQLFGCRRGTRLKRHARSHRPRLARAPAHHYCALRPHRRARRRRTAERAGSMCFRTLRRRTCWCRRKRRVSMRRRSRRW